MNGCGGLSLVSHVLLWMCDVNNYTTKRNGKRNKLKIGSCCFIKLNLTPSCPTKTEPEEVSCYHIQVGLEEQIVSQKVSRKDQKRYSNTETVGVWVWGILGLKMIHSRTLIGPKWHLQVHLHGTAGHLISSSIVATCSPVRYTQIRTRHTFLFLFGW